MVVETFLVRMPNIYLLLKRTNTMATGSEGRQELLAEVFSYSFPMIPFVPLVLFWLLLMSSLLPLFSRWKIDRIEWAERSWDEMRNNKLNIWLVVENDVNWKLNGRCASFPSLSPLCVCVQLLSISLFKCFVTVFRHRYRDDVCIILFAGVCFCIELWDFANEQWVVLLFYI